MKPVTCGFCEREVGHARSAAAALPLVQLTVGGRMKSALAALPLVLVDSWRLTVDGRMESALAALPLVQLTVGG